MVPSSLVFFYREQSCVQKTGAVNLIHCHGDQPSGNTVHGSLLPQQVRGSTNTHTRTIQSTFNVNLVRGRLGRSFDWSFGPHTGNSSWASFFIGCNNTVQTTVIAEIYKYINTAATGTTRLLEWFSTNAETTAWNHVGSDLHKNTMFCLFFNEETTECY